MRRLLLALPLALVIAAAVAAASGAFSSAHKPGAAASTSAMQAGMMMPTSNSSAAKTPATFELHRAVVKVKIVNFAFQPARLVVSPRTRVVWTNEDSDPHTVTSDSPGFSSQALDTGNSYTLEASHAGSFPYHCTIHPFMHGTLVVKG